MVFSELIKHLDALDISDRGYGDSITQYEQGASSCFVGKSPRFVLETTEPLKVILGAHANQCDQRLTLDRLQRDFVIAVHRKQGLDELEWRKGVGVQIEKIADHLIQYITYSQLIQSGYLLSLDRLVQMGYAELHREQQGLLGLLRYSMLLSGLRKYFLICGDLRTKLLIELMKAHGEYCPNCLKKATCTDPRKPPSSFGLN